MKNNVILLFVAFFFGIVSCKKSQSEFPAYIVEGVVDTLENGKWVYLSDFNTERVIDSTLINNGKFIFKGIVDTVRYCQISTANSYPINVILEDGTTYVDISKNMVKGGLLNETMIAYSSRLSQIYESVPPSQNNLLPLVTNLMDSTLKANTDNIIGGLMISEMLNWYRIGQMDSAIAKLSKNIRSLQMVQSIIQQNEAVKKTIIGQKFTDFSIKQPDGSIVSLSDYAGKGKYVLVDFWASWCGPCMAEIPKLKKLYDKYKGDSFEIVGVTVGDKSEDSQKAMDKYAMTWPQILNGGETLRNLYGRRYIPFMMLISPDGTILSNNNEVENFVNYVDGILNEK